MKRFFCQCGQPVFFDSLSCVHCGAGLGFDPTRMLMLSLDADGEVPAAGEVPVSALRLCRNGRDYQVCNWLCSTEGSSDMCLACALNRTIPNLAPDQGGAQNLVRWRALEAAKRRLLYTTIDLGLPLINGHAVPGTGLLFDFLEDGRSNPLFADQTVNTGHLNGVITINVAEADAVARELARKALNEQTRTVLGHMRHESGHYFFERLADLPNWERLLDEFRACFGDERLTYNVALARYYEQGPVEDWNQRHISAYASAHPAEDWAETWGHYLHIYDVLDTAVAHGVVEPGAAAAQELSAQSVSQWRDLTVVLNELNRSLGLEDAYPFVVGAAVERKLEFVSQALRMLRTDHPAAAGY